MNTILDHRGYGIKWDEMSKSNQNKHMNNLTFVPKINDDYSSNVQGVPMFRPGKNCLWVPKHYGIRKFGPPGVNNERDGDDIDITFNGELNAKQLNLITPIIESIENKGGGVICLPTGYGKTVIGVYLACYFKKRTLWVTHQSNLLQQTKKSFETFSDAKVGIIKQEKVEVDNPVVIGMIQSISIKEYDPSVFDKFGLVIFDEVHRVPSLVFSKSLWKLNTKRMIGLSATPERKDGLHKIIEESIGPIIMKVEEQLKIPLVRCIKAEYEKPMEEKMNSMKKPNIPAMTNDVCYDNSRNAIIMNTIRNLHSEGRTVLVLTHRRQHAELLANGVKDLDPGLYLGGMKDLDESNKKQIIIGTYSMCAEGYDNKFLNTVMLTTSKRDIRQTVGRVLGLRSSGSIQPMIVDIVDTYSVFRWQARARRLYYEKQGFEFD